MSDHDWPMHELGATGLRVGPCAWRATMLADNRHLGYLMQRPSLIVAWPDDDEELLREIAPHLSQFTAATTPLLLGMREPEFARRLPDLVRRRLDAIGRQRAEIVALWPHDPVQLKAGASLQALAKLREAGLVTYIGLASADLRMAEWLARTVGARVLLLPYGLREQSGRYRAIPAATDAAMACVALSMTDATDIDAVRFALGDRRRVLPVFDAPLPPGVVPLPPEDVDAAWQRYQEAHRPPPPLPASHPPPLED